MTHSIAPHGGQLIQSIAERSGVRPSKDVVLQLDNVARADLEMLAHGGYSPLRGFLGSRDRERVAREMRLGNGTVWPIPITLNTDQATAARLAAGDSVGLAAAAAPTTLIGVLSVSEVYERDAREEAKLVFGTDDMAHPGVALSIARGNLLVAGDVTLYADAPPVSQAGRTLTPLQTRQALAERGWTRVVGFQTRNPIHRAHEYIIKCALEIADGLLLHPLIGATKDDDVPADVRLRCYEALINAALPKERVLLTCLPAPMRYAGPREAVLHALVRQNYGCTHFIVGRDHAGVGTYYGTYDAQKIFERFAPADIGITPLFFEHSFFCRACGQMASSKTCPHDKSEHVFLSGTKVRDMLRQGERPPVEFTRASVADVLISWAHS